MLTDIVHVYDLSGRKCAIYDDVSKEHLVIAFKGGSKTVPETLQTDPGII